MAQVVAVQAMVVAMEAEVVMVLQEAVVVSEEDLGVVVVAEATHLIEKRTNRSPSNKERDVIWLSVVSKAGLSLETADDESKAHDLGETNFEIYSDEIYTPCGRVFLRMTVFGEQRIRHR